jgi:hypothetical protein
LCKCEQRESRTKNCNCSGECQTCGAVSRLDIASGFILKLFSTLSLQPHYVSASASRVGGDVLHCTNAQGYYGDRIQYGKYVSIHSNSNTSKNSMFNNLMGVTYLTELLRTHWIC